jgi:hypothetical protein
MAVIKDIVSTVDRRVRTHEELGTTLGMLIKEHHLRGRLPNALGIVTGYVPGHGGEVFWVRHAEGPSNQDPSPVGAYMFDEFEFVDESDG